MLEPAVGVDDDVGVRVRVCVTVAVWAGSELEAGEVTVTVVGSVVVGVSDDAFPPRIESPGRTSSSAFFT